MNRWITASVSLFFVTLSGCLIWGTLLITRTIQHLDMEIDNSVKLIDKRAGEVLLTANITEEELTKRLAGVQADANTQITGLRSSLFSTLQPVTLQTTSTLARVSALLDQLSTTSAQVPPILQAANKTLGDTDLLIQGVHPEAVGLLRDTRLASAELARTTLYVRQQTPTFLDNFKNIELDIKQSTESSVQASAATAAMMKNLQKATTPLPAWIRIPLSITGAVAPTVAGAVSAAAATGAFQK